MFLFITYIYITIILVYTIPFKTLGLGRCLFVCFVRFLYVSVEANASFFQSGALILRKPFTFSCILDPGHCTKSKWKAYCTFYVFTSHC